MLRSSLLRAPTATSTSCFAPARASHRALRAPVVYGNIRCQQEQTRKAHAISNPTLANIESRWDTMPPQEQADLWMALRDRMKNDWNELTMQEKKAAYWIAFGPHGPRAEAPPGEGWKIVRYTVYGLIASAAVFYGTRHFARPPPKTMSEEWQKATNEYARKLNLEPISGVSSEGYKGKGFIQSKPSGKSEEELTGSADEE